MIFADSNELAEFVQKLLQGGEKDVIPTLEDEDQRLLGYATRSIIKKMPKELQPRSATQSTANTQTDLVNTPTFPSMFEGGDKKTYEYINENIDNMKRIADNYSQLPKEYRANSRMVDSVQEEKEPHPQEPIAQREGDSIGPPTPTLHQATGPIQIPPPKSQQYAKSIRSIQSSSLGKPPGSPNRNPFLPNNINFTDKHANSKVIAQKYPYLSITENSRNLAALAQATKYNAFSQSVAYPTTVLGGTMLPPRDTTFSKETKLDVQDVMRYTLGVKRQKSEKGPLQNPFMRAPRRRQ